MTEVETKNVSCNICLKKGEYDPMPQYCMFCGAKFLIIVPTQ